jgi:hypothetical protein
MLKNFIINFRRKSLKERFLLVMGSTVFLAYLVLGMIFIFWKSMPVTMPSTYRIAFGVLLIVYSFIRFFRVFNFNDE